MKPPAVARQGITLMEHEVKGIIKLRARENKGDGVAAHSAGRLSRNRVILAAPAEVLPGSDGREVI